MRTYRPRRISRGDAEQMLGGRPVDPQAGPDPLANLLAAVASPARADELTGEDAAAAAFREASLAPVTQPRRDSMIKIALAKLLTVKVAAAAVAATAVSGVAVAASTGALSSSGGDAGAGGRVTTSASATASLPAAVDANANASASALVALCRTYTSATAEGQATADPALVTAAGGAANVTSYCTTALTAETATSPSGAPTAGIGVQLPGEVTATVGSGATVGGQIGGGSSVEATVAPGAQVGATVAPGAQVGATLAPGAQVEATAVPRARLGNNSGQ